MVEKIKILELINDALEGTDKFWVNIKITPDNRIFIDIDGDNGITIDDCIELSRAVESKLNRDEEDFELNVGSAGLDQPLKLPRQYIKNVGRSLDVTLYNGEKLTGQLTVADKDGISLHIKGTKKALPKDVRLEYGEIKAAVVVIEF